jgi:hypothetical protein
MPFDHPLCPRQVVLDLTSSPMPASASSQWPLAAAVQKSFHSDNPIYLPDFIVDLPDSQRAWGDVIYSASCYKISNLDEPSGRVSFLIVGMNPRRPFDQQYADFLKDVSAHQSCPRAFDVTLSLPASNRSKARCSSPRATHLSWKMRNASGVNSNRSIGQRVRCEG